MTEIKYRGPLTKGQQKNLIKYLHEHGKLLKSNLEKVVFFDTSIFPQIGDFKSGFSRMSIKSDTQGTVLRIKEGNPSDRLREVKVISIKKKECSNLIYILNRLGLIYGFYRPAYRQDFALKDIIFSIKTQCIMGDHFEIKSKKGMSLKDSIVLPLVKRFNLSVWSKQKYQKRIHSKMKMFPPVDILDSNIFPQK